MLATKIFPETFRNFQQLIARNQQVEHTLLSQTTNPYTQCTSPLTQSTSPTSTHSPTSSPSSSLKSKKITFFLCSNPYNQTLKFPENYFKFRTMNTNISSTSNTTTNSPLPFLFSKLYSKLLTQSQQTKTTSLTLLKT